LRVRGVISGVIGRRAGAAQAIPGSMSLSSLSGTYRRALPRGAFLRRIPSRSPPISIHLTALAPGALRWDTRIPRRKWTSPKARPRRGTVSRRGCASGRRVARLVPRRVVR
jgi:hypothetical protein